MALLRPRRLPALATLVAIGLVAGACVTVPGDGASPLPENGASPAPEASPTSSLAAVASSAPASSSDPTASLVPVASSGPIASLDPTQPATPPTEAPPTPLPRSAEPSIGYILLDGSQAYVQAISGGVREAAAAEGVDLIECDASWTREGVLACANQLAAAGVHGVISFQPFADLAADVCAITGDAPTIGIVYDQGPCQVSSLQVDQAESGRLAGEALGRFAAERWDCDVKAYLSLESAAGDPIGAARMQGYRDGYAAHCELPKPTRSLEGAQHLATARTQVAATLEKLKGKPIVVAGVSEAAILGAMEAAAAAGREKHLWYSGQLAEPAIREHIACNDRYVASVAQFPERFGSSVVPVLMDAIEGQAVPATIDAELALVTSENVRELFPDTPACGG